MSVITMRLARGAGDVETVVTMWNRAAAWLAEQDTDQWQYPVKRDNIVEKARCGQLWLAEDDGRAVGTVTVDEEADPELWQPSDLPEDALYVHRLVVDQVARGHELGSAILDWVAERAQQEGKHWIRLDAWSSNSRLHRYYTDRGFSLVRIVRGPQLVSGALLQRPVTVRGNVGPLVTSGPIA